jgi:hypothetical protein
MVYRSKVVAKLTYFDNKPSEVISEKCCMCEDELPGGVLCLRKHETNKIICVPCLAEIAIIS